MLLFLIISAVLTLIALIYLIAGANDLKKWQTLALVIAAPLLSAVIYTQIGTPTALNLETKLTADTHNTSDIDNLLSRSQLSPKQIQRAIESLRAKIEENPNDIESLNLLATTYLISNQTQLAVLTLEDLISQGQTDPDTLIKTADTYTFVEQGHINLRAKQLLEIAMAKNPNHPQGLWLSGMAAVQDGDDGTAKKFWERLLPLVKNTPQETALKDILTELADREDLLLSHGSVTLNEKDILIEPEITIEVSLAAALRENNPTITDQDTVFVFAQAVDGPTVPLAVKRLRVADLPTTVSLTEQDAMLPETTILQFSDIKISAKISKSGNPTIKKDDIESKSISFNMADKKENYSLIIE